MMPPSARRVLIAEDSPTLRSLFEECLLAKGYEVVTEPDGQAAWESFERSRPDVLITDYRMPRLTGLDLLKRVAAADPKLPVVFITSEGSEEIAAEAINLGAAFYLIKGSKELLTGLENAVDQCLYQVELERQNRYLWKRLQRQKNELEIKVAERTADLKAALDKMTALDKLKSDFITLLSHEIRTPLTSILGFSQVLDQGLYESPEELTEILGYIHASGERLSEFVNDALELFRWYSGMHPLDFASLDVSDWIQRCLVKVAEPVHNKGLRLVSKIPERVSIEADAVSVERALDRVLDNAVKFTAPGGIITVRALQVASKLRVDVEDTGVGIDPKARDFVFRPMQICGDITHHTEGQGLSLALVKEAIHAHGGEVRVDSEGIGKGALVSLLLPLEIPTAQRRRLPLPTAHPHPILARLDNRN